MPPVTTDVQVTTFVAMLPEHDAESGVVCAPTIETISRAPPAIRETAPANFNLVIFNEVLMKYFSDLLI